MPDRTTETGEFGGAGFRAFIETNLKGLTKGQEEQGKRITDMHTRQDEIQHLLQGPLGKPQEGLVSRVNDNRDEIGYIKTARNRNRSWIMGILGTILAGVILGVVLAHLK